MRARTRHAFTCTELGETPNSLASSAAGRSCSARPSKHAHVAPAPLPRAPPHAGHPLVGDLPRARVLARLRGIGSGRVRVLVPAPRGLRLGPADPLPTPVGRGVTGDPPEPSPELSARWVELETGQCRDQP